MKYITTVSFILVLIGSFNWGLIGLSRLSNGEEINLLYLIFGQNLSILYFIYTLIGLSGIWILIDWYKNSRNRRRF